MRDVFILGAGFSKAISQNMPTLKDVSESVFPYVHAQDPKLADDLAKLGNSVELWMSFLSQSQPWLSREQVHHNLAVAHRIRERLCHTIETHTNDTRTVPEWLNALVENWHDQKTTVVTLNYDTLIERVAIGLPIPREETDPHELVVEPPRNEWSARPQASRCAASARGRIGHTSRADNKADGRLWARPSGGRRNAPRGVAAA